MHICASQFTRTTQMKAKEGNCLESWQPSAVGIETPNHIQSVSDHFSPARLQRSLKHTLRFPFISLMLANEFHSVSHLAIASNFARTMAPPQVEVQWYTAYPTARTSSPASISRQQLVQMFKDGKEPGRDFALVDLRRTDFEVCGRDLHQAFEPLLISVVS